MDNISRNICSDKWLYSWAANLNKGEYPVEMTVKEALASQQALQQFGSNKFPIQVSLTLAKNLRTLNEVSDKYNDRRNDLVKKHGKKNPETNAVQVTPENQEKFADEINKLVSEEVTLTLKTVSLADLGRKVEMEPNVLVALQWMITMEGQKPTSNKRRSH